MIRRHVLYPLLLAAYPTLSLYTHNLHEIRSNELVLPLGLSLGFAAALWGGLTLICRKNPHRGGLVALPLLILAFTLGLTTHGIKTGLDDLHYQGWLSSHFQLLTMEVLALELTVCAVLVGLAIWIKKPEVWTRPLNLFALILTALPLATVLTAGGGSAARVDRIAETLDVPLTSRQRPDIYYIILDGFGRADVLRELYDYDLEPFLAGLERRGFFVARESISNYSQTRLSLASSLNGSYLDDLRDADLASEEPLYTLIHDSGIVRALRKQGYTTVSFDSGYHLTERLPCDEVLSPFPGLGEFYRQLIHQSALGFLIPNPIYRDPFAMARARIRHTLKTLPSIAERPEPTFTFAHIVAPHPPFLFQADGREVDTRGRGFSINDGDEFHAASPDEYVKGYRGQVAFLVQEVESLIDRLLIESPEPPIILIQADHGPGSHLAHGDADRTDHHERMSILNTYYFPGVERPAELTPDISPVNSFRVLLNTYFAARLERLDDRAFYATWWNPYHFVDVTDRVRPPSLATQETVP
jgi:hypothetical protein